MVRTSSSITIVEIVGRARYSSVFVITNFVI